MAYDEKTAGRVRKLLSVRPDVVEKKIMGGLCFMVKDRMCCSVSGKGGLLIRVGSDAHQLIAWRTARRADGNARARHDRLRSRRSRGLPNRGGTEEVGEARRRVRGDDAFGTVVAKGNPT